MRTAVYDIATFNFNSDLSGDVVITTSKGSLDVPGQELIHFIASYVRDEKIRQLEEMTAEEMLGI